MDGVASTPLNPARSALIRGAATKLTRHGANKMSITAEVAAEDTGARGLERGIDWTGAFWVASGVPPLVLFSIGAVAATVGKLSWVIWTASIAMGFIQSFTYAEIAGLFPNKAGGTSIYGAIAWVRYGKLVAPISVWCNWFAWSPVQATGSALAAGYILSGLFAPDAVINTWQITLLDLGYLKTGLSLRVNAVFVLGAVILLAVKFIQDGGILRSANTTKILGISAMIPLLLIGIVPILTGDIVKANFFPLAPLAHDAMGRIADGTWNMAGITRFAARLFLPPWCRSLSRASWVWARWCIPPCSTPPAVSPRRRSTAACWRRIFTAAWASP